MRVRREFRSGRGHRLSAGTCGRPSLGCRPRRRARPGPSRTRRGPPQREGAHRCVPRSSPPPGSALDDDRLPRHEVRVHRPHHQPAAEQPDASDPRRISGWRTRTRRCRSVPQPRTSSRPACAECRSSEHRCDDPRDSPALRRTADGARVQATGAAEHQLSRGQSVLRHPAHLAARARSRPVEQTNPLPVDPQLSLLLGDEGDPPAEPD
jgi:hypothetical protein